MESSLGNSHPSSYTPMYSADGRLDFSSLDMSDPLDRGDLAYALRRIIRHTTTAKAPQSKDAEIALKFTDEFEALPAIGTPHDELGQLSLSLGRTSLAGCLALLMYIMALDREPKPGEESVPSILKHLLPFATVGAVVRTSNARSHRTSSDPVAGVDIVARLIRPRLSRAYRLG